MSVVISIVIPVYNGANTISSCLDHLKKCDCPEEKYEIIVVDNNSTDNTKDIVKKYNVKYYFESIKGQAAARNLGARMAEGEILGFVDADCLVNKSWLKEAEKSFCDNNIDAIVGLREHVTRNIYDVMQSVDYKKYWERELSSGRPLNKICGSNCAIRKNVFLKLKGFHEDLYPFEDIDLGFRIVENDCFIKYNPNLKVKHIYLDTLHSLMSKIYKHGFSEYNCFKKHINKPDINSLMPSFGRFYFRVLERSKNRYVINFIIAILDISIFFSSIALKVLLNHNIKNYFFYKTVLNLSLFKGKLSAILHNLSN